MERTFMLMKFWQYMNSEMKKKDWLYLIFIFGGAIIFRLILISKMNVIGFDEVNYVKLAASANLHGLNHAFHTYWSPFYPMVVALFSYLISDFEFAARFVSILSSSLIIFPLFFFLKENVNKSVAYGVSLLSAFYTLYAHFGIKVESDSIYSFLAIFGIVAGWSALKYNQLISAVFVGILFGFAYLTRPEGIGFLFVFGGIIIVVIIAHIILRQKFMPYVYVLLLTTLGFGITSFPYLYFLHRETGTWTISTKGTVNQQGEMYVMKKNEYHENPFHVLNEGNTRLMQDEIYHLGTFVQNINTQDGPVVGFSISNLAIKVFENFHKLLTEAFTKVIPLPLVILLGLGMFGTFWTKDDALVNLYLLCFIIFFWFIVIPLFHITIRYFMPLLPISFIWIAKGANDFVKWFSTTVKNGFKDLPGYIPVRFIGICLVTIIIVGGAILPEFGKRMRKSIHSTEEWAPCLEQKKAGLWLKKQGAINPIIMAYNHAVSFYAGNYNIKESVEIPENEIGRIIKYARYRNVKYLVLNDRYKEKYPLIAHLLEQEDVPAELKLIYSDQEKNGLRTLIYEII